MPGLWVMEMEFSTCKFLPVSGILVSFAISQFYLKTFQVQLDQRYALRLYEGKHCCMLLTAIMFFLEPCILIHSLLKM